MQIVKKSQAGGGVAVKIEHAVYQSAKMFGRHFDEKDELYSHITRQSIDVLKVRRSHTRPRWILFSLVRFQSSFKTDVSNEEWLLIKALKPVSTLDACTIMTGPLTPHITASEHPVNEILLLLYEVYSDLVSMAICAGCLGFGRHVHHNMLYLYAKSSCSAYRLTPLMVLVRSSLSVGQCLSARVRRPFCFLVGTLNRLD